MMSLALVIRDGLYDDVIRIPAMTEDGRSFCEAVQTNGTLLA